MAEGRAATQRNRRRRAPTRRVRGAAPDCLAGLRRHGDAWIRRRESALDDSRCELACLWWGRGDPPPGAMAV